MKIKKENENEVSVSIENEKRENSCLDEKLPEFDLKGTALNDI